MTKHPLPRNIPPAGDMEQVETSWGKMDRWKARALALAEIQTVVREARADTTKASGLGNQTPATLARKFRDSVDQIRQIRDKLDMARKLDELEARIDALTFAERARQALLDAEAEFTSDDTDATRH